MQVFSLLIGSDRPEYIVYTVAEGARAVSNINEHNHSDEEFVWVDINYPSMSDLRHLSERHRLHPLTLEDIQQRETREKCEFYDDYAFINVQLLDEDDFYGRMRSPMEVEPRLKAVEEDVGKNAKNCIYMLVSDNCLITMHWGPLPLIQRVINRKLALSDGTLGGSLGMTGDWLAYMFLDEIVDEFTVQVNLLQSEIDTIEELTLSLGHFDQTDMLRRIYQAHRRTTILSRLIQPKMEIVKMLIKIGPGGQISLRTRTYLRDVQDHLHSIRLSLQEYAESLDRSHDNYLGQGEIELAKAGHRMNLTVKRVSSLTFVLGLALTISTIMGVNVKVPFDATDPSFTAPFAGTLPFFGLILTQLVLVGLFYTIAKKFNYL